MMVPEAVVFVVTPGRFYQYVSEVLLTSMPRAAFPIYMRHSSLVAGIRPPQRESL